MTNNNYLSNKKLPLIKTKPKINKINQFKEFELLNHKVNK